MQIYICVVFICMCAVKKPKTSKCKTQNQRQTIQKARLNELSPFAKDSSNAYLQMRINV